MKHIPVFNGGVVSAATNISVYSTNAFTVSQPGVGGVFNIDTTDLSGGGTRRVFTMRPNADQDVDPLTHVRGLDFRLRQGGIAVNTTGSRAGNFVYVGRNGMSSTYPSASAGLRALSSGFNWASTGTCVLGSGLYNTALVGGGSTVTAGHVTNLIANRGVIGFQDSVGTGDGDKPLAGSIGTGSIFLAASPNDVSVGGSHPITNIYGFHVEDLAITDATNTAGVKVEDQSSGHAIQTGTGEVELGDLTSTLKGRGLATRTMNGATGTLADDDDIILLDYSNTGTQAITLPDPSTLTVVAGTLREFKFKDIDGNCTTNKATLTPAAGTIDDVGSVDLDADYATLVIWTDGSNYLVGD